MNNQIAVYEPPKVRPEDEVKAIRELQDLADKLGVSSEKSSHTHYRTKLQIDVVKTEFVEDFDLTEQIRRTPGTFLEVGGPTEGEAYMDAISQSGRHIIVSNIYPGQPIMDDSGDPEAPPIGFEGSVDLIADATQLPFEDGSLGLLYESALPVIIKDKVTDEAMRVLSKGGLLVVSHLSEKNILCAISKGFELLELIRSEQKETNESNCDAVFVKK